MSEQEYSAQGSDHEVTEALGGVAPTAAEALGLLPQVRIVHGTPDDEEVAALVASLVATQAAVAAHAAAAGQAAPRPRLGTWTDRARALRLPPRPGPGAWPRSLHP